MKELVGHYVAYRKLVSRSPSELSAEEEFGLYAVVARFPQNLSGLVPWQRVQPGVYDCQWGTDTVRVVVAGELPREPRNAPLHLFSAQPALIEFGGRTYERRSEDTSGLLVQLFEGFQAEGFAMPFTMEDFRRQFVKEHFPQLSPTEKEEVLQALPPKERQEVLRTLPPEERLAGLPPEERLAGLSEEQIRRYLERLTAERPARSRKPRRKK